MSSASARSFSGVLAFSSASSVRASEASRLAPASSASASASASPQTRSLSSISSRRFASDTSACACIFAAGDALLPFPAERGGVLRGVPALAERFAGGGSPKLPFPRVLPAGESSRPDRREGEGVIMSTLTMSSSTAPRG